MFFLLCFSISSGCFPLTSKEPAERGTAEKASTGGEDNCVSGCPVGTWDIWPHHSPVRLSSKQLQTGRNSKLTHTHTHIQMQVHVKITLNSNKTLLGKHVHHQSPCFVLFRRMTEAAVESADVLIKTCDVTSCDVITCSSPSPCQSLCMQKEDEECRHDCKKLEQQVSDTKYCYCYASH